MKLRQAKRDRKARSARRRHSRLKSEEKWRSGFGDASTPADCKARALRKFPEDHMISWSGAPERLHRWTGSDESDRLPAYRGVHPLRPQLRLAGSFHRPAISTIPAHAPATDRFP